MKIRHISASELVEFAEKASDYYYGSIPITPWRADSQVKNPFANPDDILLVVAEEGGELLGYIGILPGKAGRDSKTRLFWNSGWWVAEGAGAKVALSLLSEFLKITNKQIAFSDLTLRTKQIIEKLGFEINERKGLVVRIKSGLHPRLVARKNLDFKSRLLMLISRTGGFKLLDLILNTALPKGLKVSEQIDEISIHKLWIPDQESYSYIQEASQNEITAADEIYFKWWFESRWLVKESGANRAISDRYYFSSLTTNFELYLLKVKYGQKIIGVALLGNREGVMKTHYLWYQKKNSSIFFNALLAHITEESNCHRLVTYHEEFSEYLKDKLRFKIDLKEVIRYTAISRAISENDKNLYLQDGDGDYIFT